MQLTEFSCFNCLGPNYFFFLSVLYLKHSSFLNVIQNTRSVIAMDETILLVYKWAPLPIYLKDGGFLSRYCARH